MGDYKTPMTRGERRGLVILTIVVAVLIAFVAIRRYRGDRSGGIPAPSATTEHVIDYSELPVDSVNTKGKKKHSRKTKRDSVKARKNRVSHQERDVLDEKI